MSQIRIVTGCNPTPDDKTLLLPQGTTLSGKRHVLITTPTGKKKLLKCSTRGDGGLGACVSPGTLQSLGGEADVTYSGVGMWGRIPHDPMLRLQALISVLTLVAAGLSAYGTWIKSTTGSSATSWDRQTATIVLIIAAVLAAAKFYKEVKEW